MIKYKAHTGKSELRGDIQEDKELFQQEEDKRVQVGRCEGVHQENRNLAMPLKVVG